MILGDFNAKYKLWFHQDNTSYEGSILNDLIAQYGPVQIIQKPTQILESSVSRSLDLLHHCILTAITKYFPIFI